MTEAKSAEGACWQVTVDLPDAAAATRLEAALEPFVECHGGTVSTFELDNGLAWRLTIHCAEAPDRAALAAGLAAAGLAAPQGPVPTVELLAAADWLAEYRRRARPVRVGRFFVYPSHYVEGPPAGTLGIALDAGLAFGTGEHESTRGCLMAFDRLAGQGVCPGRALDLGCGSGILAIAIARLWPAATVLATDNDPVAVEVAAANFRDNGVERRVTASVGQGYAAPGVDEAGCYHLIAANILADPLCAMAADLAGHLAPDGHAVLSGILSGQAEGVLGAHVAAGLAPGFRIDVGDWTTLVLNGAA